MNQDDFIFGKDENYTAKVERRVREALDSYARKPDIKIDNRNTVTKTTPQFYAGNITMPSREDVWMNYSELLRGKVNDPKLRAKVRKFSEVLMQPETFCNLDLKDKSDDVIASLKVICTLPEHGQVFANYWTNKVIESQNFKELVYEFEKKLKRFRISKVHIEMSPKNKSTISHVKTEFTFT